MKRYLSVQIIIPWFDTDGRKQWTTLNFAGYVHRRVIRKCVRKFIKKAFNKVAPKSYLDALINICTTKIQATQYTRKRATDEEVEAWIGRIQCDDDTPDTEGDARIQNQPAGEAGLEVSAMPDKPAV